LSAEFRKRNIFSVTKADNLFFSTGIPIHQQNLIFQSKELKDSRRLCDAGIKNGSTIKLVIAMKGGPISTRRLSVSCEHHMMLKELKELLENTRSSESRTRQPLTDPSFVFQG
jgi:hypothetical protein